MNLSQTTAILAKRKTSFLDIGYYDNGKKKTVFNKYEADKNWKKVLQSVFEDHQVSEVFIDIYAPNGSSYKLIESVRIENNNNNMYSNQATPTLMGVGSSASNDQFLNYIIREKDEKINDRNEALKELKDQHKLDQDTIRELREKNLELEKDNKFKEKEFELQKYEESLIDKENRKGGLDGYIENVNALTANPQIMEMAKMFLAAKLGQNLSTQAPTLGNVENPNASSAKNDMVNRINQWLRIQNDEVTAKTLGLVSIFADKPNAINTALNSVASNE